MIRRLAATVAEGTHPPGVYRWRAKAHPAALRRDLTAAGWSLHVLDGAALTTPEQVFDAFAGRLAFPAWFGRRWDALADCLTDLSWLPGRGHVLLWDRYAVLALADEKAWRQAYRVCADAIAERRRTGAPPLYVLLRGPAPILSDPPLPYLH